MLLKGCQSPEMDKKSRTAGNKQHRTTASAMKLATGVSAVRGQRKLVQRVASKRPMAGKRIAAQGMLEVQAVDPCDSSNDSGLGFEHHNELHMARTAVRFADHDLQWANHGTAVKRKKMQIKLESDDANDNFTFEETISQAKRAPLQAELLLPLATRLLPARTPVARVVSRRPGVTTIQRRGGAPAAATNHQLAFSRSVAKPHLQILSQPEQQHRARYQTEGSRGAVKDRTGNSFPAVKLVGYEGQATLQVFIGSDLGRVVPHMFYQACRVSGKNSTPCSEKTVDGTVVIEVEFEAAKDMIVTCDCVGILKERNVDVEHRFPDQLGARSKKKSTRCRMVFRTSITHADGSKETLEITSQPIVCTQPPGIPEICKKSLTFSQCGGGQELFILGKNFLKDTCVVFSNSDIQPPWEVSVQPDKEYLQQSHLVCVVPAYLDARLTSPVTIRLSVTSSGKTSESHSFTYTPLQQAGNCEETQISIANVQSGTKHAAGTESAEQVRLPAHGGLVRPANAQYLFVQSAQGTGKDAVFLWKPQPSESTKQAALESVLNTLASPTQGRPVFLVGHIPTSQKAAVDDRSCSPTLPRSPAQHDGMEVQKSMSAAMPTETAADNLPSLPKNMDLMSLKGDDFPSTKAMDQFAASSIAMTLASMPCSDAKKAGSEQLHFAPSNLAVPMATGADLSSTQSPSLATLRRFVSSENTGSPLPSLSVEKFLSGLEHKSGETSPQKTLPLFPGTLMSSSLSAQKSESHNHLSNDAILPAMAGAELLSEAMPRNVESLDESELYRSQQPLASSQHANPILIPQSDISSYGDQLMHAQMMLHGQPTTTTTMTMANSQNASSNLISATQKARLDALVSSALDSAAPQNNTQKLEELVNCVADTHLSSSQLMLLQKEELLIRTEPLEHDPLTSTSSIPLSVSEHNVFPSCMPDMNEATSNLIKSEEQINAESAKLPVQNGMMMMPSVFGSSLDATPMLTPVKPVSSQLIASPIEGLLCNSANSLVLSPSCTADTMIIDGSGLMMQSSQCATSSMLNSSCSSEALMIEARCSPDSSITLDTPCTAVPMSGTNQLLPQSMAMKNMMMHSVPTNASMFHPVQTSPSMQDMLLSATAAVVRADGHLPTSETVRLDALVNSALDSHILPAGTALENKCALFEGTSAVDCHAAGICPGLSACFAPEHSTVDAQCCSDQLHFGRAGNDGRELLLPAPLDKVKCQVSSSQPTNQEKREEVMVPRELTQMSENDLLSYINPSCFDTL